MAIQENILNMNAVWKNVLYDMYIFFKSHIIGFIIIAIILYKYSKIKKIIRKTTGKFYSKIFLENKGVISFCNSITSITSDLILISLMIKLTGLDITGLLTIFGAISIVLGFSFKDILSNFFGGLIILLFKPFIVHDIVEYKEYIGEVEKVEIFYTTIVTFQNEEVIIPNGNIILSEIKNITSRKYRRLDIRVGVGYSTNIQMLKDTVLKIIEEKRNVLFYLEKDKPIIGMYEIGASTLNFDIKVKVLEGKYLEARYYLFEEIKTRFDELHIDLPYDIIDLQINQDIKIKN